MFNILKSDYKVAHGCPTKLYYKKKIYPSLLDTDSYVKFLAKGGYVFGKLGTLYYPEGIEIETGDSEKAVEETNELLKQDFVTIFQAAIISDRKLVRVDILQKLGNQIKSI